MVSKKLLMPQKRNQSGQFESGGSGYWTGRKGDPRLQGENHPQWKPNVVSYGQLHKWARKQFSNLTFCWLCEQPGRIEMACINGAYTKLEATWAALCVKCHRILDRHPFMRNNVEARRARVLKFKIQNVPTASIAYNLGVSIRTVQRDLIAILLEDHGFAEVTGN